ncbi:hypothetical protein [Roseateles sp.]|uniref:hypothetical protein n=1 Tax=Roseateles sp. TaxID=1971397 RepID=UPI0025D0E58F|nr:hypothetical protein [Roseateles sp.]MBV8035910.1 hypothetical protein [Roseateles sp.]
MHIKPPTSPNSPATLTPPPSKPAPASGQGSDFAQLLKTAQAEGPAPAAARNQG